MFLRVLITGDRHYRNYPLIREVLRSLHLSQKIELLIQGECHTPVNADKLGKNAAKVLGIPVEGYRAEWGLYGPSAGPIRNRVMGKRLLEYAGDKLCLAFHENIRESSGTKDMVNWCLGHGVDVWLFHGRTVEEKAILRMYYGYSGKKGRNFQFSGRFEKLEVSLNPPSPTRI